MTFLKPFKYKLKKKHKKKKIVNNPYLFLSKKVKLKKNSQNSLSSSIFTLDYKNTFLLHFFLSQTLQILPKKKTKLTSKQQRQVVKTIKISRLSNFLPFQNQHNENLKSNKDSLEMRKLRKIFFIK